MERILASTGLNYRFTSPQAVALDLRTVASTVDVNATIDPLASASPKYAQPELETAQTITAVPESVMQGAGCHDIARRVA
ncbi:MAG: hypothetical protein WDO73_09365 [Ignavibacteriota bacterium]